MPKSNFTGGSLTIVFKQSHFVEGQPIIGIVKLDLKEAFPVNIAKIECLGVEKQAIIPVKKVYQVTADEIKENTVKSLFNYSSLLVHSGAIGSFPPGKYRFPFEIKLPSPVRSTFHHSCKSKQNIVKCECKYFVRASLKDGPTVLKSKTEFVIYSPSTLLPGPVSNSAKFPAKGFVSLFRSGSVTAGVEVQKSIWDMSVDNQVFLNLDTTKAITSPLNVKVSLINLFAVQSENGISACHNIVWENTLTGKLPKGKNYSGNEGYVMVIPSVFLDRHYQTIYTPQMLNVFCLRLSYTPTADSKHENSVLLPVVLSRTVAPKTIVEFACSSDASLSPDLLKAISRLFIDSETGKFKLPTTLSGSDYKLGLSPTASQGPSMKDTITFDKLSLQTPRFRQTASDVGPTYNSFVPRTATEQFNPSVVKREATLAVSTYLNLAKTKSTK